MALLPAPIRDRDTLLGLIPQRDPFVLVHALVDYEEDKTVSTFRVDDDHLLVRNGVLEAPGIIENMAQTVALQTGYEYFLKSIPTPTGYIGSIKNVTIDELPPVGASLRTQARIVGKVQDVTRAELTVEMDQRCIASCIMTTVIADN